MVVYVFIYLLLSWDLLLAVIFLFNCLSVLFNVADLQIMASSLNGLTVGDSIPDNLMDSHARTESIFYLRSISLPFSLSNLFSIPLYR